MHAVGTHDELLANDTIYQEIYRIPDRKGVTQDGEAIRAVSKPAGPVATRCAGFMDYLGRHKLMLRLVGVLAACQRAGQPAGHLHDQAGRQRRSGKRQRPAYLAARRGADRGHLRRGRAVYLGLHPDSWCAPRRRSCTTSAATCSHTCRRCRCHFFDTHRNGDLMSLLHQRCGHDLGRAEQQLCAASSRRFIQVVGTLRFAVRAQLAALAAGGGWLRRSCSGTSTSSAQRSRVLLRRQQASLGELDGYVEEMIAGQKVVKVFNHEQADLAGFAAPQRTAARAPAPAPRATPPP